MIKDIILHGSQISLVLDEYPVFKYERKGDWLIAEDRGFYSFFGYASPSRHFKAFGGREFDIPLINGEIVKANGQWWDSMPDGYDHVIMVGISTLERLSRCYVFNSGRVDRALVDEWLKTNEPSRDYRKYEKKEAL